MLSKKLKNNGKSKKFFTELVYKKITEYSDIQTLFSLDRVCKDTNKQNETILYQTRKEELEVYFFEKIKQYSLTRLKNLQVCIDKDYKILKEAFDEYRNSISYIDNWSPEVVSIAYACGGRLSPFERQEEYNHKLRRKLAVDSAFQTINNSNNEKQLLADLEEIKNYDGIKLHKENTISIFSIFYRSESQREVIGLQKEVKSMCIHYTNVKKRNFGN